MEIFMIRENPNMAVETAKWFHQKWGIPLEAYQDSIQTCIKKQYCVPQWYIAFNCGQIIGGLGVIENDFHNRKDLTPNVCAVYVEEEYRCKGVAGRLLNYACMDMHNFGIDTLYLVTDHTSFYEKYGWEFLCMVQGDGETELTRMYMHKM